MDMATLGQPAKYTFCLAENEAASPWPALHLDRGFRVTDNIVTVVGASGIVEIVDSASTRSNDRVRIETKDDVKAAIFERAQLPLDRLSPAVREHLLVSRQAAGHADLNGPLRVAERWEGVMIVVAGGVGIKAAFVPTWGGTTRAVSRRIER